MKKKIIAAALAAMGAVALTSTSHAASTGTADVYFSILGGQVSIGVTSSLNLGQFTVADTDQFAEGVFEATSNDEYFWIQDLKSSDTGYYTTLQVSDMSGDNGTIPAANVALKVPGSTTTLEGNPNTRVVLDSAWDNYRPANSALTFTRRGNSANAGLVGKYGVLPSVQVTIPAYQPVGEYRSTITYTLFETS